MATQILHPARILVLLPGTFRWIVLFQDEGTILFLSIINARPGGDGPIL